MQSLYFYRKGIVLHKSIKLDRKHQNERWKVADENSLMKKREEIENNLDKDPVNLDVVSKESQEEDNSSDKDCILYKKKAKYEFNTFGKMNDDMPDEYKHPHHGLRSVRTELYTVMSKLSSELHMSKRQIEGAIVTITNMLFG